MSTNRCIRTDSQRDPRSRMPELNALLADLRARVGGLRDRIDSPGRTPANVCAAKTIGSPPPGTSPGIGRQRSPFNPVDSRFDARPQWTPPATRPDDVHIMATAPQSESVRAARAVARSNGAAPPLIAAHLMRRLVVCSLTAAGLVGWAAFLGQEVRYGARVRLVAGDASGSNELRRLTWMLQDAAALKGLLPAGTPPELLQRALNEHAIDSRIDADAVVLRVQGADARAAGELANRLAAGFQACLNSGLPVEADASARRDAERRPQIDQEIGDLTRQLEAAAPHVSQAPDYAVPREALIGLEAELHAQRAELARLQSQDVARAEVPPEKIEAALQSDVALREDGHELDRFAEQYRTELLLALERMPEPLNALGDALHSLTRVLTEQIELKPPAPLRAALEQTNADAAALEARRAALVAEWPSRRPAIEQIARGADAGLLIEHQSELWDSISRLIAALRDFGQQARQRMDELARDGGTRESVVSSVVRGNLGPLDERLRIVSEASGGFDPGRNFRLDTAERQVRGILGRIAERRRTLQNNLQEQADRAAAAEMTQRIRTLVQRSGELENARAEKLRQLLDAFDGALLDLEARAQVQFLRGQLAARIAQRDELARSLAAAEAQAPRNESAIRIEALPIELVQGRNRLLNSVLAGVATLLVTAVSGLALVAGADRGGAVASKKA